MSADLDDVFRKLFGVTEITPDTSPATIDAWDSFTHIELIMELESRFGLVIPTATAVELDSVGKIQEFLEANRATSEA